MDKVIPVLPSVVGLTLNYRDAKRTLRCVQSLLADGVSHVLVWDNSEDEGRSAGELQKLLAEEPRVSLHAGDSNLGFAAGVNRGVAWIEERFPNTWVLLINNDAVLLPGATGVMNLALSQAPDAVIAYPSIDHGGRCIGTMFYQRHFGLITAKWLPGSIPHASGCCQLIDPQRLSGPWFDESFFMYGEDVEFGCRLGSDRMVYVPLVLVKHEGSASSGMGSIFYETRMVVAHWILARKLAKNRLDIAMLYLGRGGALTLRSILRVIRYRSFVPFKGLWRGWILTRDRVR